MQIRNQAQALQQLVDNLLAMARLQQGGVRLQRDWLPVEELVGSALAQLRERLAQHPVRTALPAGLPLLQVDAVLLERVLVNLLDNAIKYTPAGTPITPGRGARPRRGQRSLEPVHEPAARSERPVMG